MMMFLSLLSISSLFITIDSFTVVTPCNKVSSINRIKTTSTSSSIMSSTKVTKTSTTSLYVDGNVIGGIGVAVAGLVAGIGIVAFTEQQGERAKARGAGLSEQMSTRMSGQFLEDVEISSISDIGSLTDQLEKALLEAKNKQQQQQQDGKTNDQPVVAVSSITENDNNRVKKENDDGW